MDLDQLIRRPGLEDLSSLVEGWRRVSARQEGKDIKVPLPNYYLNSDDGFDFEAIFRLLADELERLQLMEFDGPRPVYSFFLKYSRPEDPEFPSFKKLYSIIEHDLSKFGHPFGGILVIDITEWSESRHVNETKFLDFLSYMATIDDRTMAVYLDRSGLFTSEETFRRLDVGTRIEPIHISYKDCDLALSRVEEELSRYGFSLEKGFREKLRDTVDMVLKTPGSDGEESIRQMALDMAYEALKSEKEVGFVLNEENSSAFLSKGSWSKSFGVKTRHRLGLIGEDK